MASHAPAPATTRTKVIVALVGIVLPMMILGGLIVYFMRGQADEPPPTAGPTVSFESSTSTDTAPTDQADPVEDDHAHDMETTMSAKDKAAAAKTGREYIDAWLTAKGQSARRKALSGLATPGNIDLMAYTDARNLPDARRKSVEVIDGDTYSATAKVVLTNGEVSYMVILRDPEGGKYGWLVGYLYPEGDFEMNLPADQVGQGA